MFCNKSNKKTGRFQGVKIEFKSLFAIVAKKNVHDLCIDLKNITCFTNDRNNRHPLQCFSISTLP